MADNKAKAIHSHCVKNHEKGKQENVIQLTDILKIVDENSDNKVHLFKDGDLNKDLINQKHIQIDFNVDFQGNYYKDFKLVPEEDKSLKMSDRTETYKELNFDSARSSIDSVLNDQYYLYIRNDSYHSDKPVHFATVKNGTVTVSDNANNNLYSAQIDATGIDLYYDPCHQYMCDCPCAC